MTEILSVKQTGGKAGSSNVIPESLPSISSDDKFISTVLGDIADLEKRLRELSEDLDSLEKEETKAEQTKTELALERKKSAETPLEKGNLFFFCKNNFKNN
jgi:hypothetical protein